MGFKTQGYGGKTMTKTILVKTDDPQQRALNLVVTGQVDRIAEINPPAVYLNGKAGDTLEAVVTITPSEKYAFTVLGLEKRNKSRIEAVLIQPEKENRTWRINIKCRSDKAEDLYDELILKTDSKYVPSLAIRVSAIFLDKKKTD
ncbi:MAG: hypothetical protein WC836_22100 [Desulfobacula sp.]